MYVRCKLLSIDHTDICVAHDQFHDILDQIWRRNTSDIHCTCMDCQHASLDDSITCLCSESHPHTVHKPVFFLGNLPHLVEVELSWSGLVESEPSWFGLLELELSWSGLVQVEWSLSDGCDWVSACDFDKLDKLDKHDKQGDPHHLLS